MIIRMKMKTGKSVESVKICKRVVEDAIFNLSSANFFKLIKGKGLMIYQVLSCHKTVFYCTCLVTFIKRFAFLVFYYNVTACFRVCAKKSLNSSRCEYFGFLRFVNYNIIHNTGFI